MKMGIVGLGRMGGAVAYRLVQAGYSVLGFDASEQARTAAGREGVELAATLADVAKRADVIWLMLPEGAITSVAFNEILEHAKPESVIIDGGNSHFEDSIARAQQALAKHISFLDCGTSGGVRGKETGFCLMVGGSRQAYERAYPLLQAIAAPDGCAWVGPSGAGHYVKMVHNGIEYALLQAYAEGFHVIKQGSFALESIDLAELSRVWNVSSVIRSFILDLAHDIFKEDSEFSAVSGEIAENGTGLWTAQEADKHAIPIKTIKDALTIRAWSRETGGNYATKLVALLRNKFGGHDVKKQKDSQ